MHLLWMLFLVLLCVQDSWQSHRIKRVPMNTSHIDLDFGLVTEDVCSDPTPKPKKDKLKANVVGMSDATEGEENLQHLAVDSAAATPLPRPLIDSDEALNSGHPDANTASSADVNTVLPEPAAHTGDTKKYAKHVAKSSGGGRHHKKKHDHHHAKEEKKRSKQAMDELLTKSFRDMLTKVFAKNNALSHGAAIDGGDNGMAMHDKDNNKHITNTSNLTGNDNGNGNGNANTHRSGAVTVNGNSNSNNATTNDGNNNANNQHNAAATATDAAALVIDVGIKTHNHNKSPAGDGGAVGAVADGASLVGAHTSGILTLPLIGKEKSKYEQQLERELERQQQQEEKQQRREGHEHEAAPQLGTTIDLRQIPLAKFNPSDGFLQFSKLHLYTLDGKPIRAQGGQISINANPFANMPPTISLDMDGGGDFDTIDYLFNSEMVPAAPYGAVPRGGIAIGPSSLRAVGYAAPGSPVNEFPLSRPWHYYQGSGPGMVAAAPVPPMPSENFIENALDLLLASKMAANGDDNEAADTEVELLCPLHRDPKRTSPEISGDPGKCSVNGGPAQDGGLVCSCRFIKHKHVP